MGRSLTILPLACGTLVLLATLGSCTTVNRFGSYHVENAKLAASLQVPPEPRLDVNYSVYFDANNPIGSAMSIGTNIAKAASATQAEARMRDALDAVNVPNIVLDESSRACARAMDSRLVETRRSSDFLLDLEIREYGINAESGNGAVYLRMSLVARVYETKSGELVWRRNISVNDRASPSMFNAFDVVGNVVTAGVLSNMTTDQLERGFERLASESARSVARTLERDLYSKRYNR